MDFFKSVFAAEPTSPQQEQSPTGSPSHSPDAAEHGSSGSGSGDWRTLIQTFASKSESVIQTYRRDLEEFGFGLKKETEVFREVAARAVLDLPTSLEAGASKAQQSLESVGQAIDEFGGSVLRGTAEIISQGKEAIISNESEGSGSDQYPSDLGPQNGTPPSRRYSRFEAQVLALQSDVNTFSGEPEDAQDFDNWKSGFDLAEKEEEIEKLCYENWALEGFLEKLVPRSLSYETFWYRYYYRVHKLQQAEEARAKLVKRVISAEEEEDLSWEVDDEEEEEVNKDAKNEENLAEDKGEKVEDKKDEPERMDHKDHRNDEAIVVEKQAEVSCVQNLDASAEKNAEEVTTDLRKSDDTIKEVQKEDIKSERAGVEKHVEVSEANLEGSSANIDERAIPGAGKAEKPNFPDEGINSKSDDKTDQGRNKEATGLNKDSKPFTASSHPSVQDEDDLEWDEIEDLSEHDENKPGVSSVSPHREGFRKMLTVFDDEDLSWDIEEEDDEPTKR